MPGARREDTQSARYAATARETRDAAASPRRAMSLAATRYLLFVFASFHALFFTLDALYTLLDEPDDAAASAIIFVYRFSWIIAAFSLCSMPGTANCCH